MFDYNDVDDFSVSSTKIGNGSGGSKKKNSSNNRMKK